MCDRTHPFRPGISRSRPHTRRRRGEDDTLALDAKRRPGVVSAPSPAMLRLCSGPGEAAAPAERMIQEATEPGPEGFPGHSNAIDRDRIHVMQAR